MRSRVFGVSILLHMLATWFVLGFLPVFFIIWLVGSTTISSVKAYKQDCGKTYKSEGVLYGDMFCSK
mgnify:CR=1 FL=1